MRLLFIQSGFGAGGAEKVLAQIASHRAELGDCVHVAGMNMPQGGSYFSFSEKVQLHALEYRDPRNARKSQWARLSFIRALRRNLAPDVAISFLTKINALTLLGGVFSSTPIVISERNNLERQAVNPLWRLTLALLAQRANSTVVLNEATVAGIPSVSFDGDCGPSFPVENGVIGILVPPKGLEAMTQAALQLIADTAARKAMSNSASINREKLDPRKALSQWYEVIVGAASLRGVGRTRS